MIVWDHDPLIQCMISDMTLHDLLGEGGKMVDRGDNTYGGKYVVNPSGGLISKGHPLGATGR